MLSSDKKSIRVRHARVLRLLLSSRYSFLLVLWLLGGRALLRGRYPRRRVDLFLKLFFVDIDTETGQLDRVTWQRILSSFGGAADQEVFGSGFFKRIRGYLAEDAGRRKYFADLGRFFLLNEIHREMIPPEHRITAMTLDVTQRCNITCTHCFANSGPDKTRTLDTDKAIRFIKEAIDKGGCRFVAILGGEPLLEIPRIVAIAEAIPFTPIIVFTNGSMATDKTLAKLRPHPNIALFASIEGFRELTDDIRVSKSFDWAHRALEAMKRNGMIYGVSLTANRRNYEEIVSDEFVEYLDNMGVMFSWIFDYKPLGRASLDESMRSLVIDQAERDYVNAHVTEINKRAGFIYINTEKDPAIIGGCPAHRGTYMHVSCEGYITPCIAVRHFTDHVNIDEMSFEEIMDSPFLRDFRKIGEGEGCPGRYHPVGLRKWQFRHKTRDLYEDETSARVVPVSLRLRPNGDETARGKASLAAHDG